MQLCGISLLELSVALDLPIYKLTKLYECQECYEKWIICSKCRYTICFTYGKNRFSLIRCEACSALMLIDPTIDIETIIIPVSDCSYLCCVPDSANENIMNVRW